MTPSLPLEFLFVGKIADVCLIKSPAWRQEQHQKTEALTKKQLDLCQQRAATAG
jgi:hypothetical protein